MYLLLGNCQLQRMMFICGNNGIECEYLANTERLDSNFDFERTLEAVESADVVIAQPIFNDDNPINHKAISSIAKEVVFFPYVYIDGIFSISSANVGSPVLLGQEIIDKYNGDDLHYLIHDFIRGNIDFKNAERFGSSLDELTRRESVTDSIKISDIISDNYQKRQLLISHNHPEKWLMDILCSRLFSRLNWNYRSYTDSQHYQRVDYLFGAGETVLSPYDVDRMSLDFPSDDQWWTTGHNLLSRFWNHHQANR